MTFSTVFGMPFGPFKNQQLGRQCLKVSDDEEEEDGAARMPFAMVAAVLIVGKLAM